MDDRGAYRRSLPTRGAAVARVRDRDHEVPSDRVRRIGKEE